MISRLLRSPCIYRVVWFNAQCYFFISLMCTQTPLYRHGNLGMLPEFYRAPGNAVVEYFNGRYRDTSSPIVLHYRIPAAVALDRLDRCCGSLGFRSTWDSKIVSTQIASGRHLHGWGVPGHPYIIIFHVSTGKSASLNDQSNLSSATGSSVGSW